MVGLNLERWFLSFFYLVTKVPTEFHDMSYIKRNRAILYWTALKKISNFGLLECGTYLFSYIHDETC
jgi:hypothetical protein